MTEHKPCHNCRRRRLRCDRSVPACYKCSKTGQRCLGYGKVYRWVGSDSLIGQGEQRQGASSTNSVGSDGWLQGRGRGRGPFENGTLSKQRHGPQQTLNIFLADPLLQDLSRSSRYYLSYFASRFCQDLVVHDSAERGTNPFRELIPLSQTYSYLQHIIIAVSAVHYYHSIKYATSKIAEHSRVAQNALIDALRARHDAIRELRAIIQERQSRHHEAESKADQDAMLATILFFVNFTLIDSGKGWKDHLTAAGRLLSVYSPLTAPLFHAGEGDQLQLQRDSISSSPSTPDPAPFWPPETSPAFLEGPPPRLTACDYIASDTIAYSIWNCAVESLVPSSPSPPSSPSQATDVSSSPATTTTTLDRAAHPLMWDVPQVLKLLSRTEANSYHSCPAYLMSIVLRTAQITQSLRTRGAPATAATAQMNAYISLLAEAEAFDVEGWAAGVSTHIVGLLGATNAQELRLRCHIAATYRAAVCLYILLVAPGLPAEVRRRRRRRHDGASQGSEGDTAAALPLPLPLPTLPTTADLAATIAQRLSLIPKTSPLFKYTVWPIFLTGVDAAEPAHRRWVIDRLCAMRDLCPWSMMTAAMETLAEIWKLRDATTAARDTGVLRSSDGGGSNVDVDEDGGDWLARLEGLKIECLIV
ncbi:fungal-specific transcription factor domain-containing protein [Nemania sp. NC0429]|nr:fungal-specific transcription factor domain-containing protein [Nemania sp. NC0429]